MSKEVKKVKCKKCRLTYDKKLYECPYCHKKRFNPTGLIIFLIILAVAAGAIFYFFGDKIKEKLSSNNEEETTTIVSETVIEVNNTVSSITESVSETTETVPETTETETTTETTAETTEETTSSNEQVGLVFKNLTVERSEEYENRYIVKFDIENTTNETIQRNYTLKNLVDKVNVNVKEANSFFLNDNRYVIFELVPEEICKVEYEIIIENEWNTLEIYLTEDIYENDKIENLKIFTFENNIPETTTETTTVTTDVSIITEQ